MSLRHQRIFAPALLLAAAMLSFGCESNGMSIRAAGVGPTAASSTSVNVARGAFVQPALITPVLVTSAVCPTLPPFIAPFTLVFDANGRPDLFLTQVHLQFIDHVGVVGGTMTLRHTELLTRFGSTTLPLVGTRAFPLSFPFGCVGAPTGTLVVMAFAGDSFGRETSTRVQVPVRFSR
jgi:hypothetical protein